MVHLTQVPNDKDIDEQVIKGLSKADFFPSQEEDTATASVYGSRFAVADLPRTEMPETEMPKEVAYRMIK